MSDKMPGKTEVLEERVLLAETALAATMTPLATPSSAIGAAGLPAVGPSPLAPATASAVVKPAKFVTADTPAAAAFVPGEAANQPIGVAQGLFAGRVTWAHNSSAVNQNWDLNNASTGYYWEAKNNNQAVADELAGQTVRWLMNQPTDQAAWDALFRNFNSSRGLGNAGYKPGEKICIKVNLNNTWAFEYDKMDPVQYQMGMNNWADTSPQSMLALLNQLVNKAGVRQQDIYLIEPGRYFVDRLFNALHPAYPDVHYVDRLGINGREKATATATPILKFSNGTQQAYLPQQYVDAKYLINLSILKKHEMAGFTCVGKNQYGAIWTTDNSNGIQWSPASVHDTLPTNLSHTGSYSQMVDINGDPEVGGKTLLYMADALWGGWNSNRQGSEPQKWLMAPFYGQYPASLFASQDFVAIESVVLDFLRTEDALHNPPLGPFGAPMVANADNSLHEAALANTTGALPAGVTYSGTVYKPDGVHLLTSMGVHEHWNNSAGKQYSRNLGTGNGIELISSTPDHAPTSISLSNTKVPEKRPAGTVVGTFATIDPDAPDTFTYSLPGEVADNGLFTISGNQLLTGASFDYQVKSSYSIQVRSTDQSGLYVDKAFAISVLDVTAPTIASVKINDGSVQRSMVNKVVVTFSEAVTLAGGALSVVKSSGAVVPNVTVTALNPSQDQRTWELTFGGTGAVAGSLPDGMYKVVVLAVGVSDLAGNRLAGDYSKTFHRLFGDVDGDRDVDAKDLAAFKQALNRPASYVWWLDSGGDTKIDNADYLQLRARLLKPLLK